MRLRPPRSLLVCCALVLGVGVAVPGRSAFAGPVEDAKAMADEGRTLLDDAAKARWFPLSELRAMESQIYEDHFYIIERFIGTL